MFLSAAVDFVTEKQAKDLKIVLNRYIREGKDIDPAALAEETGYDVALFAFYRMIMSIKQDFMNLIVPEYGVCCYIDGQIADHEGYVMSNDYGTLKLVNRQVFSFNNFNLAKAWWPISNTDLSGVDFWGNPFYHYKVIETKHMWDEIADMQGEIFDISEEDREEIAKVFAMSEEEYDEYWNDWKPSLSPQMNNYLTDNLLPLVLQIERKKTESYLLAAAGLGDKVSQNGVLIQLGNQLEIFWNKVISDCSVNLIEESNRIDVNGRERQLDHLFAKSGAIQYLESKCNLNFDSEKNPASNQKVLDVKEAVEAKYNLPVQFGYFVPCIAEVPTSVIKKYGKKGITVYGVNWMIDTLGNVPFTSAEFFTFFQDVLGPIITEMLENWHLSLLSNP